MILFARPETPAHAAAFLGFQRLNTAALASQTIVYKMGVIMSRPEQLLMCWGWELGNQKNVEPSSKKVSRFGEMVAQYLTALAVSPEGSGLILSPYMVV